MQKIILLPTLFLFLSPLAFGQSRVVEINQLGADYAATPPTVTFEVFWNTAPTPPRHRDTVWVFVDYQPIVAGGTAGNWTAATVTDATATGAGAIVAGSLNGRGFYLKGTPTAPFSSTLTVTLDASLNDTKFNWCAYVTDYPPNATVGAGFYELHGTPPFEINGSVTEPTRQYTGCITSLTDATGCPGLIPAPPAAPILTAAPDSICAGDTTTLTATATDAAFYSFNGGAWTANSSATFSPTATAEYTIYIKNAAGCTATGAPATVTVVPPPVPVFINPPATYCADSTFTITASAGAGSSYCFTQTYTGASHNPYLSGNDTDAGVDCEFPTIDYCSPSGDSTFTVRMPESGSVTVCVRAWNTFGCYADTCVTIGATPAPAFALISPQGTNVQTIPLGQPLTTVTYGATDATDVTVTGLPAGLTYTWNAPNVEITGTAAASATVGAHSYTVTAVGHCGTTTTQGVITIAGELFSMTTTNPDSVYFSVSFTGTLYIDWGDGSSTYTTGNGQKKHFFVGGAPAHTVTAQAWTVTTLSCDNKKLTALDVTQCPSLTYLYCPVNQLTALDVTKNTALVTFACGGNQLTALDVTKNTAATYLACGNNPLTALDVSSNTALIRLSCINASLTALNVTKNTAINYLECDRNQLTALDVSKNTALTTLNCSSNSLTALNVKANGALTTLYCGTNKLNVLDISISHNPYLTKLQCNDNLLTVLDVSQHPALTELRCGTNPLSTFNISNNLALTILECSSLNLTALDIHLHTLLKELYCGSNPLDTFDISHNLALTNLDCNNVQLTALDVSQHTALKGLRCSSNQLTSLDVTTNTALTDLRLTFNQLTETALNDLFYTLHPNPGAKSIFIRGNPWSGPNPGSGANTCDQTIATGKGWTVNTTN